VTSCAQSDGEGEEEAEDGAGNGEAGETNVAATPERGEPSTPEIAGVGRRPRRGAAAASDDNGGGESSDSSKNKKMGSQASVSLALEVRKEEQSNWQTCHRLVRGVPHSG